MKKTKKDDKLFSLTLAVPNKYTMEEAVEFVDRQMGTMRNKVVQALAAERGIKIEWTN